MTATVLIEPRQTVTGIGVGQEDRMIWALSNCCSVPIHFKMHRVPDGSLQWECSLCLTDVKLKETSSGITIDDWVSDNDVQHWVRKWTGFGKELTLRIDR